MQLWKRFWDALVMSIMAVHFYVVASSNIRAWLVILVTAYCRRWIDKLIVIECIVVIVWSCLWVYSMWTVLYDIGVECISWGPKDHHNPILWIWNCIIVDLIVIWLWYEYTISFTRDNIISGNRVRHISTKTRTGGLCNRLRAIELIGKRVAPALREELCNR